jgi:NAD(P)H dehydrogenase (quinone)
MLRKSILLQLLLLSQLLCVGQKSHTILVTYFSQTGKTAQLADAVVRGAKSVNNVQVILKQIQQTTKEDLLKADAIIIGSPVYNANPASEVLKFIEGWPFEGSPMKNKIGAVFVTGGGISAGEELAQVNLLHSMLIYGMVIVGGADWTSAFGASAITDEGPFKNGVDDIFLKKGEGLGKGVAESVVRWGK